MRIERNKYLQELIDRKHNGLVKVITGRRTFLLTFYIYNEEKVHISNEKMP